MRLGLAKKLYPEVHPTAICKACKSVVGPDIPAHCFACSKPGKRGRNIRHTAVKNTLAIVERLAEPGTHVIMEPFVTAVTGAVATEQKYARSRADISVRATGVHYIVDATIVDATNGPKPANTPYEAGKATEEAFKDKVKQYTVVRFNGLSEQLLRVAAFDIRGGPSSSTLAYLKEIKHRERRNNPGIPKSVIAARLYQRVSVAIQRAIAYNIMEYRLWRVPVPVPVLPTASPAEVAIANGSRHGRPPRGTERDSAPTSRGAVQHFERELPAATPAPTSATIGTGSAGGVSARSVQQVTSAGGSGQRGANLGRD
jgi:hypothetical protein